MKSKRDGRAYRDRQRRLPCGELPEGKITLWWRENTLCWVTWRENYSMVSYLKRWVTRKLPCGEVLEEKLPCCELPEEEITMWWVTWPKIDWVSVALRPQKPWGLLGTATSTFAQLLSSATVLLTWPFLLSFLSWCFTSTETMLLDRQDTSLLHTEECTRVIVDPGVHGWVRPTLRNIRTNHSPRLSVSGSCWCGLIWGCCCFCEGAF